VQSLVFWMRLQFAFQVRIIGNLARVVPLLSRVVVRDVPQFGCTPRVVVKRFLYLVMIEDTRLVCSVDVRE
jgi:hypothetical protein